MQSGAPRVLACAVPLSEEDEEEELVLEVEGKEVFTVAKLNYTVLANFM